MDLPFGIPAGGSTYYPPVGFHFDVRILDAAAAIGAVAGMIGVVPNVDGSFQEVSGISVSIETESLEEGGENRFAYKLPTKISYTPLVLKRGYVSSVSALGEWCQEVFENGFEQSIQTKDILVNLLSEDGTPLMSWTFIGAYPTKWSISNFNAQNNEIVVETLEFFYKRFEVMSV
jgi:phage tail-like protein